MAFDHLASTRVLPAGLLCALLLVVTGPAQAALMTNGTVVLVPNIVAIPGTDTFATALLDDGFGSQGFTSDALGPSPLSSVIDISSSFSGVDGATSSTVGFSLTSSGTSLTVVASPPSITLSQTDLSVNPNGPAVLELLLAIPFTYTSLNPTEPVTFDLDFDVSSNIPVLTATDSFTVESCLFQGDQWIGSVSSFGTFATNCTGNGGTPNTLVSLGNGTSMPVSDPVGAFVDVVNTNVPYIAHFGLTFQIQNDTGPTTLSVDGFSMSMAEVPEPNVGILAFTALVAALGRFWRRASP